MSLVKQLADMVLMQLRSAVFIAFRGAADGADTA